MALFKAWYIFVGFLGGLGVAAAIDGILIAVSCAKKKKKKKAQEERIREAETIMENLLKEETERGLELRDGKRT